MREKSAVAEHVAETAHEMNFEETQILATGMSYFPRLHREAIEIHKHGQQTINRKEEGLKLNKAWLPALRQSRCAPYKDQMGVNAPQQNRFKPRPPTGTADAASGNTTHSASEPLTSRTSSVYNLRSRPVRS